MMVFCVVLGCSFSFVRFLMRRLKEQPKDIMDHHTLYSSDSSVYTTGTSCESSPKDITDDISFYSSDSSVYTTGTSCYEYSNEYVNDQRVARAVQID
jgi:hypothetical protein